MSAVPVAELERRLLVLAPVGRDADLIQFMLRRDAVLCERCRNMEHVSAELERGASALLLVEEALAEHEDRLAGIIARQPPWSDLPVLLLTRPGADSAAVSRAIGTLGNVTLLERPMRVEALASAVRSALRARERQFQTRAHLEERETANQRKDQFLATLAHELRNPLAPIRTSLALLRLSRDGSPPAQVCDIMERQVNHMVRLVDDLLEVSRITRGKIELRRESVDLAAVISSAVETSRPLVDAAHHALTVELPAEPIVVDADAIRLAQVFSNLLNNAAKYTDPGGCISISVRREKDAAVVAVTDTGIGIPAQALPGVFDMFAQVNARDTRAQNGLGIGLTLVRSLVEMHGGSVTAASDGAGKGSEFVVRLPLDRRKVVRPRPPENAPAMGDVQRILIVDDNRDAASTLGALLQLLGLNVRTVNDGPTALDEISSFHPSVVVLDLGMPGMDGYEVARRVRERPDCRDIALVALTGWGQEKDRHLTEKAGFNHHLVKPVDIGTMQAVLASLANSGKSMSRAAAGGEA